jgi:hypothetical protein
MIAGKRCRRKTERAVFDESSTCDSHSSSVDDESKMKPAASAAHWIYRKARRAASVSVLYIFSRAGCANNNLRAGFLRNVKGKSQAAP